MPPAGLSYTETFEDFSFVLSLMDLLVGAPLFMDRGSDGKLKEVGQVSERL